MSAVEALRVARENGVRLVVAGADLVLRADREPAPWVLEAIRRHKAGIVALLAAAEDDWTAEQIAAVLLRSSDYGDVWLVRDDEVAAGLIAELERGARPIPVITFDEVALLRGKSTRMLQAVLTAKAALPGSRLLQ